MTKAVKEFLLDQGTGDVNFEFSDNTPLKYNLSNAVTAAPPDSGIGTYAEMLTQCVGSASKLFFLASSEINNGDPAQYFYDGNGGVWWAAMVKVN